MNTDLPEIWQIYSMTTNISPLDQEGLPSLSSIEYVTKILDFELDYYGEQFLETLQYLHLRNISGIIKRRKK